MWNIKTDRKEKNVRWIAWTKRDAGKGANFITEYVLQSDVDYMACYGHFRQGNNVSEICKPDAIPLQVLMELFKRKADFTNGKLERP